MPSFLASSLPRFLASSLPRFLASVALTLAACDEPVAQAPVDALEQEIETDDAVLVFESVRVLDPKGALVTSEVVGEVTPAVFQRAGRPWSYFDEAYLYHEVTWSRPIESSENTEHGYQILRTVNPTPVVHKPDDAPTKVNTALEALLTDEQMIAAPQTMVHVLLRLRDFPDWDIPLLPASIGLSAEDALTVFDDRETAFAARTQLFDVFAEPVVTHVEAADGEIVARLTDVGWLTVRVPWSSLPALIDHPALSRLTVPDFKFNLHWNLGDSGDNSRMDTSRFLAVGHTGEQSNPGRHAFGDITVGVIDSGFEDEACAFFDGAHCTGAPRIQEKFLCDDIPDSPPFSWCAPVDGGNYAESDEAEHGTKSASVILGDYTQSQACNVSDPPWNSPPPAIIRPSRVPRRASRPRPV